MNPEINDKKIDDIHTRIFDPKKLLDVSIVDAVFEEFRNVVPNIFGSNLAFGFVFGGFAKGYAVSNQDADFYICNRKEERNQVDNFRFWYFDVHERYGLWPDIEVPGSISTLSHLREKIEFAKNLPLRPIIETHYEAQSIIWCDIMSGPKAAKIGDLTLLNEIETSCELLPQKWRREALSLIGENVDLETTKLPITRLFRKAVKYMEQGDRDARPENLGPPS
ncbi:hypothetical protein PQR53_33145 [Paraburkholderia fungorum]|uniref:hypothetical protein n=1 Tax=Paraburkholderia fungorum TaxID=134537 RepID=UPI0038BDE44F